MIKEIICLLWGHKTVHKAYTGEKLTLIGRLGNTYELPVYRYEVSNFCTRCGRIPANENRGQ